MAATALLPHLHPTLPSSSYSNRFPLFHLSTKLPVSTTTTPSLRRILRRCKPPLLHAVSPPFSLLEESSDLESDGGEEAVDGFESDGGEESVDGFESDGGEESVDKFQSGSESDEGDPKRRVTTPLVASSFQPPKLTTKEKKELVSYARSLGKKLDVQQVGKSGVTPSLAAAFRDNLEANELLKVKVHGTCPLEFVNAVKQLEQATSSIALGQVGRTVILYRPSLSKMKRKEEQAARERKVRKPRSRFPPNSSRMSKNGRTRSFSRSSTRNMGSPTRRRSS